MSSILQALAKVDRNSIAVDLAGRHGRSQDAMELTSARLVELGRAS